MKSKSYKNKVISEIEQDILDKLQISGQIIADSAIKNAPIKTGALRDSITFEVNKEEKSVRIGTNLFYAPFIEFGTKYIKPRFFLTKAARNNISKLKKLWARKVK